MSMNKTVRSDKQSVRGVENLPKKGKKWVLFWFAQATAIMIIIILQINSTYWLPPVVICENTLISECVITHNHKLFVFAYKADKMKQLTNSPSAKSAICTCDNVPSI